MSEPVVVPNQVNGVVIGGSQTPPTASPAENKPGATSAPLVEGTASKDKTDVLDNRSRGLLNDLLKQRARNRQLEDELTAKREEIEKVKTAPAVYEQETQDGSAQLTPQQLELFIEKRVRDAVAKTISKQKIEQNQSDALDRILSQKDVQTQDDVLEIKSIMESTGLDALADTRPMDAVDYALDRWHSLKGKNASPAVSQSASTVPGGAVGGGKNAITAADIRAMSREEYKKRKSEIETAIREGRIE